MLLICCLTFLSAAIESPAVLMRNGVASSEYEQHSLAYQGSVLWVSAEFPNGARYPRGSGVRLNEWYGLTAAHIFNGQTNAIVGTGSDRWFDRGVVRKITEIKIIPGYNSSASDPRDVPDLAIIKFDRPLPGPSLSIGGFSGDEILTSVGFGNFGYANQYLQIGHNRRAWDAQGSGFYLSWPNYFYLPFYDDLGFGAPYLGGKGVNYDSGSPCFNSAGQLVGIVDNGSLPQERAPGDNGALYLPYFLDWITANTAVPDRILVLNQSNGVVRLEWDGPYVLQTCATVNGPFTNVTNAMSPYTNFVGAEAARFFRLVFTSEPPLPSPTTLTNLGTFGSTANAVAYYSGHEVAGAIPGDASNRGIRTPVNPGDDGGIIEVPYHAEFNQASPFSVEVWAKPGQTLGLGGIAGASFLRTGQYAGWGLYQRDSGLGGGGFSFDCFNSSSDTTPARALVLMPVDTNAWYHLIGVFDGSQLSLYLNGVLSASSAIPSGHSFRPNPSLPMHLGCVTYVYSFTGDLDEAAFYTNALSAEQVLAHYQTGTNASPVLPYSNVVLADNPAGYWRLDEPAAPAIPEPLAAPARMIAPAISKTAPDSRLMTVPPVNSDSMEPHGHLLPGPGFLRP